MEAELCFPVLIRTGSIGLQSTREQRIIIEPAAIDYMITYYANDVLYLTAQLKRLGLVEEETIIE